MAVQDAVQPLEAEESQQRLVAWSSAITWAIFLAIALLIGALVYLFASQKVASNRLKMERQAWDARYKGLKDKQKPEEKIEALEKVWEEVSGSSVHPYVMLELAQLHFLMAQSDERSPAARGKSLERARLLFDLLAKQYAEHLLYGAMAADGLAACCEESGELEQAIEVLTSAVVKYEDHFLFPKFCYQLGRDLWMRSGGKEGAGKERSTDRAEAKRWLGIAASGTGGSQGAIWRSKAAMLKSQLEKHGVAWPGNTPPPPRIPPPPQAETPGKAEADKALGTAKPDAAAPSQVQEQPKAATGKSVPESAPLPKP